MSDTNDIVIQAHNNEARLAFANLNAEDVGVFKLFMPIEKRKLNSFDFVNHFDRYFGVDTNSYAFFFFKKTNGYYEVFGASIRTVNADGSVFYYPITSTNNDYNVYLNQDKITGSMFISQCHSTSLCW